MLQTCSHKLSNIDDEPNHASARKLPERTAPPEELCRHLLASDSVTTSETEPGVPLRHIISG